MEVLERLDKAMQSIERAKNEYKNGDKRLALGSIDFIEERTNAAKWLLINEINQET